MESSTEAQSPAKFAVSLLTVASGFWSVAGAVAAALKLPRPTGVAEKDDRDVSFRSTQICKQLFEVKPRREPLNLNNLINLRSKLSYLRCKLFALLSVLPLCRFLTLDHLKQVNMLLLELFLLK